MKRECDRIGDAVWEYVRFGVELCEDDRQHVAECQECERILAESRRVQGLMKEVSRVPQASDCTSAVMSRITARRRPVWGYAATAAMMLLVIVGGLIFLRPHSVTQQIAREVSKPVVTAPAHAAAPEVVQDQSANRERIEAKTARRRSAVAAKRPRRNRRPQARPAPQQRNEMENPASAPEQIAASKHRPVMVAAATWSNAPSQSSSCTYTETNETTGETSICKVEKSPGTVTIFMESKPGGEKLPQKGI